MKTLIAYASKTGAAKKCAEYLNTKIENSTLCDLDGEKPDLSAYDAVIIGGGIRMGAINKAAKKFITKNIDAIKGKKYGIYICNGLGGDAKQIITQNFTNGETSGAVCVSGFGGELNLEKLKGMDKFIASAVAKDPKNKMPELSYEAMDAFVKAFTA